MSEMIERVARALAGHFGPPFEQLPKDRAERRRLLLEGETFDEDKDGMRDAARAAIEAMREPTEAMIEASNREWDGRMSHRSSGAWSAMIDAALRDNKGWER